MFFLDLPSFNGVPYNKNNFWIISMEMIRASSQESNTESLPKATGLLNTFLSLLTFGLITQVIYIIYIVAFPLISNTQAGGPAADLEILMRDFRWFAPIYTLGILVVYFIFWRVMLLVMQASSFSQDTSDLPLLTNRLRAVSPVDTLKWFILGFGSLFSFTLIWLYPITANDIFRYVLRGRIWTVYGESPMLVPPNTFPNDPYIAFAGEFGDWVSGYGPLWEIVVQGPLQLGATEMVWGTVSLKFVVWVCFILCAILLGWVAVPERSSSLAALTFFAWNPLILIQILGNGHNDMVFMLLMVIGIIFFQRQNWILATLFLTLSVLAKAPALLIIPLFAVVVMRQQRNWSQCIIKGIGMVLIGLVTAYLVYSVFGPVSDTLRGVSEMLTTRRGFAIASELRMILREVLPRGAEATLTAEEVWGVSTLQQIIPCQGSETLSLLASQIIPCQVAENMPRTMARNIFFLFYAGLLIQLWRKKLDLVAAAFLAYFAQLMLGRTFRIWYPTWLIPLAALYLTSATFWRTMLFSLMAELSIINYFVVWRWWLRHWSWNNLGLLATSYYWPVMHTLTIPWLFGVPLFGPILLKWLGYSNLPQES